MSIDLSAVEMDPQALLSEAAKNGVSIFGLGSFAVAVRKALQRHGVAVKAHIVTTPQRTEIDGIPVLGLARLSDEIKALPMWIGVLNHRPESDYSLIRQSCLVAGVARLHFPQHYFEALADELGWRFWLTDRANYGASSAMIEKAHAMLDSDVSRRQFEATIDFRLGKNLDRSPAPDSEPQYFPSVVVDHAKSRPGTWLADGGAYDGDTLREAAGRLDLKAAFAFEPDPGNFQKLCAGASQMSMPVTCFPCGLSSATGLASFSSGNGEASAIGGAGNTTIQIVALDDCLHQHPVNFIKLDVEGHEIEALRGAQKTIRSNRPILAVAAYHLWDDIWRIPEFVHQLDMGYRLAYRTHEHNSFESIYYAY